MKNFIALVSLTFSLSVFSCPDFTGHYHCVDTDNDGVVTKYKMKMKTEGNVYTSTDDEGTDVMIADGVAREIDGGFYVTTSCEANSVVMKSNGTSTTDNGDRVVFNMNAKMSKVGSQLLREMKAKVTFPDHGVEENIKSTSVCTMI